MVQKGLYLSEHFSGDTMCVNVLISELNTHHYLKQDKGHHPAASELEI